MTRRVYGECIEPRTVRILWYDSIICILCITIKKLEHKKKKKQLFDKTEGNRYVTGCPDFGLSPGHHQDRACSRPKSQSYRISVLSSRGGLCIRFSANTSPLTRQPHHLCLLRVVFVIPKKKSVDHTQHTTAPLPENMTRKSRPNVRLLAIVIDRSKFNHE